MNFWYRTDLSIRKNHLIVQKKKKTRQKCGKKNGGRRKAVQPVKRPMDRSIPIYSGQRNNKNAISVPSSNPFQILLVSSISSTFSPLCHEICHLTIITLLWFSFFEKFASTSIYQIPRSESVPEDKICSRSEWTIIALWFFLFSLSLLFSIIHTIYLSSFLQRCFSFSVILQTERA